MKSEELPRPAAVDPRRSQGLALLPAQIIVLGFLGAIAVGTLLLSLPVATASGQAPGFTTALFTATSAVCVTGLIVVNTAEYWSPFGQTVILVLIQVGGLGIMTLSTMFALLLGRRISLKERLVLREALGQINVGGMIRLLRAILILTFVMEGLGALLLTLRFLADYPLPRAAALGVFHAVSAFNNAGFDIFGNSLESFRTDPVVNLVVIGLVVVGGLGFAVIMDLRRLRDPLHHLSLNTKMVLTVSAALLVLATLIILIWEGTNPATLGGLEGWGEKLMAALFAAAMPRTAGFNTIPIGEMTQATLFFLVIMMFIGASPGSTGGGVKTTTFGVIAATVWATIRGKDDVELFHRRLTTWVIGRSLAIVSMAMSMIILASLVLSITEAGHPFIEIFFEATSAFGTVGLSTGLTPDLSTVGRLVIIITMFAGRVGPLTLAVALAQRGNRKSILRMPEEKIMVG